MLSELLSCHTGCNVEHFLQNGFRTVFCEVYGRGHRQLGQASPYCGMMIVF